MLVQKERFLLKTTLTALALATYGEADRSNECEIRISMARRELFKSTISTTYSNNIFRAKQHIARREREIKTTIETTLRPNQLPWSLRKDFSSSCGCVLIIKGLFKKNESPRRGNSFFFIISALLSNNVVV